MQDWGVVIVRMVSGFSMLGIFPRPSHMIQKLDQGGRSGQPSTVGVDASNVHLVGVFIVLPEVHHFASRSAQRIAWNAHIANATRRENIALDIVGIRLTRDLLDDPTEHTIPEVGNKPSALRGG